LKPLIPDEILTKKYQTGKYKITTMAYLFQKRISLLLKKDKYDLIWIQKELLPWMPKQIEMFLLRGNTPIVIDFDDAEFIKYNKISNKLLKMFMHRKIENITQRASNVIVGNSFLKESLKDYNSNISVIPTVIDLAKYPEHVYDSGIDDKVIIGWIGSPSTQEYLYLIENVLELLSVGKKIEVHLIGANNVQLKNVNFKEIPWAEDTYIESLKHIDIGIMPLADTLWEQGKCGFKLLQYMGMYKPVVASPIGANEDIVKHGVNGFLATTEEEWLESLMKLIEQPLLRREMGIKGRASVEKKYSLPVASRQLLDIINNNSIS